VVGREAFCIVYYYSVESVKEGERVMKA